MTATLGRLPTPEGARTQLRLPRVAARLLLLVAAYYVSARLGLKLQLAGTQATPVWPPSGIAVAAVLLAGPKMAAGIFFGAFFANMADFFVKAGAPQNFADFLAYFASHPAQIALSAVIGTGNALEAVFAWQILRARSVGSDITARVRRVLIFALAAFAGSLVAASIGVGSLYLAGFIASSLAAPAWLTWALGDWAGIVIFAPFLLAWLRLDAAKVASLPWRSIAPALGLLIVAAGVVYLGWFDVGTVYRQGFLLIPILLWVAIVHGDEATTSGIVIVALTAVLGTLSGQGPFVRPDLNDSLIVLQEFVAVVSLTMLVMAAVLRGRFTMLLDTRRARDRLDRRIKEATAKLRESEERYRLLVDGVADYAIFMLTPDGRVASWNSGAERMGGYTAQDILGRHFSIFYTQEERDVNMPARELEIAARQGRCESTAWRLRKDGSRFMADVVLHAVRDEAGHLTGFGRITRDITRRFLAAEELEKTREALVQAQKMEALGQLTSGIAHDFNNLLTVIVGNLELLLRRVSGTESRVRRAAEDAMVGALRAATLTQRLLAFARKQPLAPRDVDLKKLVGGMAELLRRTLGESITCEFVLSEDLAPCVCDPHQLETAILNLVINARDAMPEGGKLTLSAANREFDETAAALNDIAPGSYVMLTVTDTGVGMAPETRARAIEPFFTTKEVGKGSGLGLSMVYGFVRQSQGQTQIESSLGRGTSIRLYLPRSRTGTNVVRPAARAPAARHEGRNKLVLVVEDDDGVRDYTISALQQLGYRALGAGDGAVALRVLDAEPGVEILFIDVGLPGRSGPDVATEAKRRHAAVKIVFTTGYGDSVELPRDGAGIAYPLLCKPFTAEDLARTLDEVVGA